VLSGRIRAAQPSCSSWAIASAYGLAIDRSHQRGDITYIPTWEGWLCLATVIDCHTKAVIGYAMDDNYNRPAGTARRSNRDDEATGKDGGGAVVTSIAC
jgi:transposase InsO family protein